MKTKLIKEKFIQCGDKTICELEYHIDFCKATYLPNDIVNDMIMILRSNCVVSYQENPVVNGINVMIREETDRYPFDEPNEKLAKSIARSNAERYFFSVLNKILIVTLSCNNTISDIENKYNSIEELYRFQKKIQKNCQHAKQHRSFLITGILPKKK